eukprot:Nk52_evm15s360 gene=Nk52_evmTU15s360
MTEVLSTMSFDEARKVLREHRKTNCRDAHVVVDLGENMIKRYSGSLGDELWDVYEQTSLAALDLGKKDLAVHCLNALDKQFPGSSRVSLVRGRISEFEGKFAEAIAIYDAILEKDEFNNKAMKRKIAIFKGKNDIPQAIEALCSYLKTYMADFEAWIELASLYISQQNYQSAAFCYEELILSDRQNYSYYEKYAECVFTIGGLDNYILARKFFSQALNLNNASLRSLYGVYLACAAVSGTSKGKQMQDNAKLGEWAAKMLKEKYAKQNHMLLPYVQAMLDEDSKQ